MATVLYSRLLRDQPRRFQLILGPRRVGKTTVMYQTVRHLLETGVERAHLCWMRLDHPLLLDRELGVWVKSMLRSVGRDSPLYLFLDEVTYAERWDLWLKTFYDEAWPLHIVATSSATAAIRRGMSESGVGRWEEQYLPPYSFFEYLHLIDRPVRVPVEDTLAATLEATLRARLSSAAFDADRRRFMLTGGFPELLLLGLDDPSALLQSQRVLQSDAVERAVYKDIPQAFGVDNPMLLDKLLCYLAGQISGILSPTGICQSLGGMSQPTLDKYVSYLERAFLVFQLPCYSGSEAAVQRRGRKLYFVDGAVRNAALLRGLRPLQDPVEQGLLLENLVASHLHMASQITQVRLYHWRERELEVDLIYDHPEAPLAFEVASSRGHSRGGLLALQERFPRFRGRCYLVSPRSIPTPPDESGVGLLPLNDLLLAVGAHCEVALRQRLGA